jgi:hypothetical protein
MQAPSPTRTLQVLPPVLSRAGPQAHPGAGFAGNQAMLRRLSPTMPHLQCKLEIGAVNDPLETEADRVADEVMHMPEPACTPLLASDAGSIATASPPQKLHRTCAACRQEDEDKKLSRKETGSAALDGAEAPPIVHEVLDSPGEPLEPETRAFFEPRFGTDFSRVRVHKGHMAAESARAVSALAYTAGSNLVFGDGQYAPEQASGRLLLAHELSHAVQQNSSLESSILRRQPSGLSSVNPASLSDAELAAEYERLLRASDPEEELTFEAVDAEIQRRASQRQQSSSQSSSSSSSTPTAAAAGHAPGGPYHPPEGTELSCTMADSCSQLSLKINYLTHTIESHQAWDAANPDPAYPGGRHAMEITELTTAVNNCKDIYTTKCTNQPKFFPVPVAVPAEEAASETAAEAGEILPEVVEAGEVATEGFELGDLVLVLLAL